MDLTLGLIAAYLLGSIPFALLTVRCLAGVDVRKIGSGNVGASNAARAFGRKGRLPVFVLVYLLDFGKGALPTHFGLELFGLEGLTTQILMGAAAIVGHCSSPFLGFKGGKGVATATGVFFVLSPVVLIIALAMFFLVLAVTRVVFLGSLSIGITLVVGVIVRDPSTALGDELSLTVFCLLLALFLFFTHRSNILKFFGRERTA